MPSHTLEVGRWPSGIRSTLVVILVLLGALSAALALPALWTRNIALNTDRYVQAIGPVGSQPGLQNAVIAAVDRQVTAHLDVEALIARRLPAAGFLAGPLQQAAEDLARRTVSDFVRGDAFAALWVQINRTAHARLVSFVRGEPIGGGTVALRGESVVLDLAPVIAAVTGRLVSAGLSGAATIPTSGVTLQIAEVRGLTKVTGLVSTLNDVADWLPWVALASLAGAIALARRRLRMVAISGLSVAVGMLLIGIGLIVARSIAIDAVTSDLLSADGAAGVFDAVTADLHTAVRVALIGALLVSGLAVSAGQPARAVIAGAAAGLARKVARWRTTAFATWLARHRRRIWLIVPVSAAIVLVLWDRPSLAVAIIVLVTGAVLLVAMEVIRPG